MSNSTMVRRVLASVVAASALGAAAPALAAEVAATTPTRDLPACCRRTVADARDHAEARPAPSDARRSPVTRDDRTSTDAGREDPLARHPYWEGP